MIQVNQEKRAVVDQSIEWKPLDSCPRGSLVWLLSTHNNSFKGIYKDGDTGVKGWYPHPNIPEWMK